MSTAPLPGPQKKPNTVVWVLGTIGGLLVILVGFGLVVGFFVIRNFRVRDNGKEVQIHIPGADLKVNKTGGADVGLPVYPGAAISPNEGVDLQFTPVGKDAVSLSVAKYTSDDPIEKEDAWYREHLGSEFERKGPGGSFDLPRLHHIQLEPGGIAFAADDGPASQLVILNPRFGHVEIVLLRGGRPAAQ